MPLSTLKSPDIVHFITQDLLSAETIQFSVVIATTTTSSNEGKSSNKRSKHKDSSLNPHTTQPSVFDAICSAFSLWTAIVGTNEEIEQWARNYYNSGQDLLTYQAFSSTAVSAAAAVLDDNETDAVTRQQQRRVMSEGMEELIEVLFTTMLSNGHSVTAETVLLPTATEENDTADDVSAAEGMREVMEPICQHICHAATLAFISLLRLQSMADYLSVEHWKCIAWKFLENQNPSFRKRLIDQFGVLIQTCAVHPKFLAFQSLLATDEKYCRQAQVAMIFAMKRLRSSHEILSSRVLMFSESSSATANDEENEQNIAIQIMKKKALDNMPETILPYVLYLLSYHPEFPTSSTLENESDERKVKNILRSVTMVIDSLLASLKRDADNLSYLLKQVNTIVQDYVDCNDPANIGLHFVSRLTIQKLKEHIKTSENVSVFPGEIALPMTLFQRVKRGKHRPINDEENQLYMDIGNTQDTFEKVFQQKVKKTSQRHPASTKQIHLNSPTAKATSNKNRPNLSKQFRKRVSDEDTVDSSDENDSSTEPTKTLPVTRVSLTNRPVRATRTEVNYKEKDESLKEAEKWEKKAAAAAVNRYSQESNQDASAHREKKRLSHASHVNIEANKKIKTSFSIWKDGHEHDERLSQGSNIMNSQSQTSSSYESVSSPTTVKPRATVTAAVTATTAASRTTTAAANILAASKKINQASENTVSTTAVSVQKTKTTTKNNNSKRVNGSENNNRVMTTRS